MGPNKAAPPMPDDIEQIATQTHVGNINQYLEKSISEKISENVTALVTAAVDNKVELVETIGDIISGCRRSKISGELDKVLITAFLT